ncbi:hypothetical protein JYU28_24380 [Paenibacillus polymyxa]|nr:hypothetical protein [Paenibacillus polymyxa]
MINKPVSFCCIAAGDRLIVVSIRTGKPDGDLLYMSGCTQTGAVAISA